MPSEPRRYTPIYRDIMEEPDVWDDDVVLAWWLRLRLTADRSWPEPAGLPRRCPDEVIEKLVGLEKIVLLSGDQYRCRGVEMDRTRKSDQGRAAAEARWSSNASALHEQSGRTPPALPPQSTGNAQPMPTETETETDTETSLESGEDVGKRARNAGQRANVTGFTRPMR